MPTIRDVKNDEILEPGKEHWVKKAFHDVTRAAPGKQLAVGGTTGWITGYASAKIGRAAAVTMGVSLLLLQIAAHKGYVKVNWNKMEKEIKEIKKEIEKTTKGNVNSTVEDIGEFVRDNVLLAGGFVAGFLIGIAS